MKYDKKHNNFWLEDDCVVHRILFQFTWQYDSQVPHEQLTPTLAEAITACVENNGWRLHALDLTIPATIRIIVQLNPEISPEKAAIRIFEYCAIKVTTKFAQKTLDLCSYGIESVSADANATTAEIVEQAVSFLRD